jgi:transcriptional regulator with XRE-family HTH domain
MGAPHHSGAQRGVASVNNIQRFREARGWSRPKLAQLMETSPQQIERLEKGMRALRQEWIDRAAEAFGVTPAEIISPPAPSLEVINPGGPPPTILAIPPETTSRVSGNAEIVQIQKLDLSLSMGPGTLIGDYVEAEPLSFDLAFIRTFTRAPADRLKLVTGIGDSMQPTLQWGDLILIDTTDRQLARQDGLYWIDLWGAAGLKRLRTVGPGRVLVKSDNPAFEDQEVDASDLRIEGRAVWIVRGA